MNKEITIYELLGLIKDGQAPKKIKYKGIIYEYIFQNGYTHKDEFSSQYFVSDFCADYEKDLNDKVKIIEEDNKIEPYTHLSNIWTEQQQEELIDNFDRINTILNKLIDEIQNIIIKLSALSITGISNENIAKEYVKIFQEENIKSLKAVYEMPKE